MTATINKVTHYDITLNLSQSELDVFKAIMTNLKISEVMGALCSSNNEQKIVEIYDRFRILTNINIKVGN